MSSSLRSAYTLANSLSDTLWQIIQMWNIFSRTIIGNQFIMALDNVAISLAKVNQEMSKPEQQILIHMAQDFVTECLVWNDKARRRRLLSKEEYQAIYVQLRKLQKLLNKTYSSDSLPQVPATKSLGSQP